MISRDTEYSMLKQEIISMTDIISNITVAMYTITVSIIVLAFETKNAVIFLTPYIVLYPFQNIINRKISSLPPNPKADSKRQFAAHGGAKPLRIKKLFEIAQPYPGMCTEQLQGLLIMGT